MLTVKRSVGKGFKNGWLSHEDSNLDKQNQNLSYYLYTMGQLECKSKVMAEIYKLKFTCLNEYVIQKNSLIQSLSDGCSARIFFLFF